MSSTKDLIIEQLKEVYDPEIPINVYDLGLIYEINEKDKTNWEIIMTLTSPTCPTQDYMKQIVKEGCERIIGNNNCEIKLVFEPRWDQSKISQDAKEELGLADTETTENKFEDKDLLIQELRKEIKKLKEEIKIFKGE